MGGFGGTLWGSGLTGAPPPPGTLPAQSYIYLALRRCGHLRPGYQPSQELLNDAMLEWMVLFDLLNAERNMNFSVPAYTYPVTGPGSQTNGNGYSVGPTGTDWVGPRPESIIWANLVLVQPNPSQPNRIPMKSLTAEEWAGLSVLQIPPISIASVFYYDPQWPNGVFNVFPPLLSGNSIELYCWGILTPPTSLSDMYGAPPGYAEMVVCCLAERLYPLISKELAAHPTNLQELQRKAHEARENLRRVNRAIQHMRSDYAGGRHDAAGTAFDSFITWTGLPS